MGCANSTSAASSSKKKSPKESTNDEAPSSTSSHSRIGQENTSPDNLVINPEYQEGGHPSAIRGRRRSSTCSGVRETNANNHQEGITSSDTVKDDFFSPSPQKDFRTSRSRSCSSVAASQSGAGTSQDTNPLMAPSERGLTDIEILSRHSSSALHISTGSATASHSGDQQQKREEDGGGLLVINPPPLQPQGRQGVDGQTPTEGALDFEHEKRSRKGSVDPLDEDTVLVGTSLHGASRFKPENGLGSLFAQLYLQSDGTRLVGHTQPPPPPIADSISHSGSGAMITSLPMMMNGGTGGSPPSESDNESSNNNTPQTGSLPAPAGGDVTHELINLFSIEQRLQIQQVEVVEGRVKDGAGLLWPCPMSLLQHQGQGKYSVLGASARESTIINMARSGSFLGSLAGGSYTSQRGGGGGGGSLVESPLRKATGASKNSIAGAEDFALPKGEKSTRDSELEKIAKDLDFDMDDAPPFVAQAVRSHHSSEPSDQPRTTAAVTTVVPTAVGHQQQPPASLFAPPEDSSSTPRVSAPVSSSAQVVPLVLIDGLVNGGDTMNNNSFPNGNLSTTDSAFASSATALQSTIGFDEAWHLRSENFFLAPLEFIHDDYLVPGVPDGELRAERKAATLHIIDHIPGVVNHLEQCRFDEMEKFAQKCLKSTRRTALYKLESVFTQFLASIYELRAITEHPTEFLRLVDLSPGRHVFEDFEKDTYSGYGYQAALQQKQHSWVLEQQKRPQQSESQQLQPPSELLQVEWNYAVLKYLDDRLRHDVVYCLLVAKALAEKIKRDNINVTARMFARKQRRNRKRGK